MAEVQQQAEGAEEEDPKVDSEEEVEQYISLGQNMPKRKHKSHTFYSKFSGALFTFSPTVETHIREVRP
jgi:hypothetical protein